MANTSSQDNAPPSSSTETAGSAGPSSSQVMTGLPANLTEEFNAFLKAEAADLDKSSNQLAKGMKDQSERLKKKAEELRKWQSKLLTAASEAKTTAERWERLSNELKEVAQAHEKALVQDEPAPEDSMPHWGRPRIIPSHVPLPRRSASSLKQPLHKKQRRSGVHYGDDDDGLEPFDALASP
ncbi:hypothetical protein OC834_003350 [Tilletia horrida]|nr:hypothetical protein OC834_003350 [Tilletia horrida]